MTIRAWRERGCYCGVLHEAAVVEPQYFDLMVGEGLPTHENQNRRTWDRSCRAVPDNAERAGNADFMLATREQRSILE